VLPLQKEGRAGEAVSSPTASTTAAAASSDTSSVASRASSAATSATSAASAAGGSAAADAADAGSTATNGPNSWSRRRGCRWRGFTRGSQCVSSATVAIIVCVLLLFVFVCRTFVLSLWLVYCQSIGSFFDQAIQFCGQPSLEPCDRLFSLCNFGALTDITKTAFRKQQKMNVR